MCQVYITCGNHSHTFLQTIGFPVHKGTFRHVFQAGGDVVPHSNVVFYGKDDLLARTEHPGNYYDREKEVAVLFGFESFECAKEPVRTGDYGYYMMRVEL